MADETTEKAEKPIDTSVKARYWWAVLYQENMVDGWRDNIGYEWTGRAHGSLADALATLAVQRWLEQWLVAE